MPAKKSNNSKQVHKHIHPNITKKALAGARELEKIPMPSKEDVVKVYKEALEEAKRLQKLLKPEWFVKDIDRKGRKLKKK